MQVVLLTVHLQVSEFRYNLLKKIALTELTTREKLFPCLYPVCQKCYSSIDCFVFFLRFEPTMKDEETR